MMTKYFRSLRCAALLALCFASVVMVQAQQRTGGGGGGGNTGGGGGARPSSSSSSSSSTANGARDYPNSTLPGDATFTYDPETHSIIALTDDVTAKQIEEVVKSLDKPKPQVLIKVVFLEVQHDNALDFGVEGQYNNGTSAGLVSSVVSTMLTNGATQITTNFTTGSSGNGFGVNHGFGLAGLGTTGQQIGQTTMPAGAGIYSVLGSDYTATVRAIASAEKVEVLSRPSIMVRNNQPATITVGQSVPLVTGSTVSALGGITSTIAYQNVGIILQVTPFISSDGMVEMIVAPQISSLSSGSVNVSSNVNAPVIDLRSASTVVVTPDGQTVIIGGLIEDDHTSIVSKIPLLGDIPYLGVLFTHTQKADTKKELIIFLTPHVVSMPEEIAAMTIKEDKGAIMSHKAFEEQELDRFFDRLPVKPVVINPPKKK